MFVVAVGLIHVNEHYELVARIWLDWYIAFLYAFDKLYGSPLQRSQQTNIQNIPFSDLYHNRGLIVFLLVLF